MTPGLGTFPGGGNGNLLQYSCLENSMGGGAWWATVYGVIKDSDLTYQLNNNKKNYLKKYGPFRILEGVGLRNLCMPTVEM